VYFFNFPPSLRPIFGQKFSIPLGMLPQNVRVPKAERWPLLVTSPREFIVNPSQPGGHYMYRQFNIQQFHVLPTQCIYVFCVDLRTHSDYFPIQY